MEQLALLLNVRGAALELQIKTQCQDLIIQQNRNKINFLEAELKKKDEELRKANAKIEIYHKMEVDLTAERNVLKESLKRTEFDNKKLNNKVDHEAAKKQKLRKSYKVLSSSIKEDDTDVKEALDEIRESLMT